ncbi:MAG: hypothetical protein Q7S86_05655 [bacterium]|nr:hypothetical protein [bacterium]
MGSEKLLPLKHEDESFRPIEPHSGPELRPSNEGGVDFDKELTILESIKIRPEEVLTGITRLSEQLIASNDFYNLEKLAHYFPQTQELFKVGALHEKGLQLLKTAIASGDSGSAVKLTKLLSLDHPIQLTETDVTSLIDSQLACCVTGDSRIEEIYELGVQKEVLIERAMKRISELMDYGNDHVSANNTYIVTNIICAIPEIEDAASKFIGGVLEHSARENVRHGVCGPLLHFIEFFEEGKKPLEPSPLNYIKTEDVEEGIRYLLTHHTETEFSAHGMGLIRNAKCDLYGRHGFEGLLNRIPLSPEFASSPEILMALKKDIIDGSVDGSAWLVNVREMLSHFKFNEQDYAEIVKATAYEEQHEPQTIDADTGDVESDEAVFDSQVKELLPHAREFIMQRRDISWIVKEDICQFYLAADLPRYMCEQMVDLFFPKSIHISAAEVKALAIAWTEHAQRLIENKN